MKETERVCLYWLSTLAPLGTASIRKLYEYFQSFYAIYNIEETELRRTGFLKEPQIRALTGEKGRLEDWQERYRALSERGIRFVTFLDEDYPEKLREIYDHPLGLFVKGELPDGSLPSVAVVGARGCSAYGEQLAEKYALFLAREGQVQILSGLALGIDSAAHKGALRAENGKTFGVLGCGIDICYPSSSYFLYEAMTERGGILSEFSPGTAPKAFHFPMRNRIISGLADAVLVVEARERSGSLITAELALEQGREVFAVPGRVTDHLSAGCNRLIQQGAHMAASPGDILEYLGLKCRKKIILHEKNINSLAKTEKMVYSFLDFKPKHLDEIASGCGLKVSECLGVLLELELGGFVFRSASQYYGRKL